MDVHSSPSTALDTRFPAGMTRYLDTYVTDVTQTHDKKASSTKDTKSTKRNASKDAIGKAYPAACPEHHRRRHFRTWPDWAVTPIETSRLFRALPLRPSRFLKPGRSAVRLVSRLMLFP